MNPEAPAAGDYFRRLGALFFFLLPSIWVSVVLMVLFHEVVGHGCAALLVGGRFEGFVIHWWGGGFAYAFPPEDAPPLSRAFLYGGGIAVNLLAGGASLALALRIKDRIFLRLGFLLFAAVALLSAAKYGLVNSLWPDPDGDVGMLLEIAGRPWVRWTVFGGFAVLCPVMVIAINALLFKTIEERLGAGRRLRGWRRITPLAAGAALAAAASMSNGWEAVVPGHGQVIRTGGAAFEVLVLAGLYRFSLRPRAIALAPGAARLPIGGAIGAASLILATSLLTRPLFAPFEPLPVPVPNGYDLLVAAGSAIPPDSPLIDEGISWEQKEEILKNGAAALERARRALELPCVVPLPPAQDGFTTELRAIFRLGMLLELEGRLAEHRGDGEAAARSYLDLLRLSAASTRGGVMIHAMMGRTLRTRGEDGLARVASILSPDSRIAVTRAARAIEEGREDPATIERREAGFSGPSKRKELFWINWSAFPGS